MIEILNKGSLKKHLLSCLKCCTDFTYQGEDVQQQEIRGYKTIGGFVPLMYYVVCPSCGEKIAIGRNYESGRTLDGSAYAENVGYMMKL